MIHLLHPGFAYIHIPKTGGTSMEAALCRHFLGVELEDLDEARQVQFWLPDSYLQHKKFAQMKREVAEFTGEGFFTFAFVRNPWDLALSEIAYLRANERVCFDATTWKGNLRKLADFHGSLWQHDLAPQVTYLHDETGSIAVDFIGRFESLEQDFHAICDRLGIPRLDLPRRMKSEHQRGHYSEYYDSESREWIARRFAEDIEAFGYEFEVPRVIIPAGIGEEPTHCPATSGADDPDDEWAALLHCPHGVAEPIRDHFFTALAPAFLKRAGSGGRMDRVTVVTYNNHPEPCLVEQQLSALSLPHTAVLARAVGAWTWKIKVAAPLRAIQEGRISTEYILLMDGGDVVFTTQPDQERMLSALKRSGAELLFCSTIADWPPCLECKSFEQTTAPGCEWPHLSAGGIFGKTAAFAEFAAQVLTADAAGRPDFQHEGQFDDQKAWRQMHRQHFPRLRVDTERTVFGRYDETWPQAAALLAQSDGRRVSEKYRGGKQWGWYLDDLYGWQKLLRRETSVRALEVGAFDGVSANMMLDCLFVNPASVVHCIDPFQTDPTTPQVCAETREQFMENQRLGGHEGRIHLHEGYSMEVLPWMLNQDDYWHSFDFIYVDGSHFAQDVLSDAVLAWNLLKPGGIIAFDDYEWKHGGTPLNCPKAGIDAFASVYQPHLVLLRGGWRRIWQKI